MYYSESILGGAISAVQMIPAVQQMEHGILHYRGHHLEEKLTSHELLKTELDELFKTVYTDENGDTDRLGAQKVMHTIGIHHNSYTMHHVLIHHVLF
jgi:hypothetical protein